MGNPRVVLLCVVMTMCLSARVRYFHKDEDLSTNVEEFVTPIEANKISVVVSDELPEGRHEYYRTWAQKAHDWVGAAIIRLRAGRGLFKKWFRLQKVTDAELDALENQVKKRLIDMQSALENLNIQKGVHCDVQRNRGGSHGTLAYVHPKEREGQAWVVHVCDFANEFRGDTSTRTLVHEISHHRGTVDNAYGKTDCMKLRPQEALQNADTYSFLIFQLAKGDGKLLYEEGSGNPHPLCNTKCDSSYWQYDADRSQELEFIPSLGSCFSCDWKQKTNKVANWVHWVFSNNTNSESGMCGDGSFEYLAVVAKDCEAFGCSYLDRHACLKASQSLGLGHESIPRSAQQHDLQAPYGCHVKGGELLFNNHYRSEVEATADDNMICKCRKSEQYAETRFSRVCCTEHECTDPKKK